MSDTHTHGLTMAQTEALLRPIKRDRVKRRDNQFHLEAWDVRRTLNQVFGFTGWKLEKLACDLVSEDTHPRVDKHGNPVPGKFSHTVIYRYEVRLHVACTCGHWLTWWDDAATGDGINLPTLQAAHDFAVKTAASQALKRAAVNLGDQFGQSLYNKGAFFEPVVGNTVPRWEARQDTKAVEELASEVKGGELDETGEVSEDEASAAHAEPDLTVDDLTGHRIGERAREAEQAQQQAEPPADEWIPPNATPHLDGVRVLANIQLAIDSAKTRDDLNVQWKAAKQAVAEHQLTEQQGKALQDRCTARWSVIEPQGSAQPTPEQNIAHATSELGATVVSVTDTGEDQ